MNNMKVFSVVMALFLAIQIALSYYFWDAKEKILQKSIVDAQNSFVSTYNTVFSTFSTVPDVVFNGRINNNYISSILKNAQVTKDKEYKNLLRDELYSELESVFTKTLKKAGFEELHFYLKDGESFLRFSKPKLYGKNFLSTRPSIRMVHQTKKKLEGFESGKFFNGYRYIYPLFYKNQFAGSVDITLPIEDYLRMAKKALGGEQRFIIKADKIPKNSIKIDKKRYLRSCLDSNYLFLKDNKKMFQTISSLSKKKKLEIQKKLQDEKTFSIPIEIDKKDFLLTFYPIKNIEKQTSGYIIGVNKVNFIKKIKFDFYKNITFTFASLILIILLAYYHMKLHKIKINLENEVKERTKKLEIALSEIKRQKDILKKDYDVIQEYSQKDELTQIYNRKKFNEEFEKSLNLFKRYKDETALVLFDIDFFKTINDTYGHLIGDEILIGISKLVKKNIRKCDIFARWGGEEFMLIFPRSSKEDALRITKKLREIITSHNFKIKESVTCSFGVTNYKDEDTLDSIIKRVDDVLYEAKKTGRDKIIYA